MKKYKLSYGLSGMIGLIELYLWVLMFLIPIFIVLGYKTDINFATLNLIGVFSISIILFIIMFTIINLICKLFTKKKIYVYENEIIYKHYKIEYKSIQKINFVFPIVSKAASKPYGVNIVYKVIYQKEYNYAFFDRIPLVVLITLIKKCDKRILKFPTVKKWYIILFFSVIIIGIIFDFILFFLK